MNRTRAFLIRPLARPDQSTPLAIGAGVKDRIRADERRGPAPASNEAMTDAERADHYRKALERIAEPEAFYVATSDVDPEAYARMIYAEAILGDMTLKAAEEKTEYETRQRYPLRG